MSHGPIVIDAHVLGTRAGGNETYIRNLLEGLRLCDPPEEIVALVNAGTPPDAACGFRTYPLRTKSAFIRTPFSLPYAAHKLGARVLHMQYTAPPFCGRPYIVSMHDAVALRHPHTMPAIHRYRLRALAPRTLHRAARIFVLTRAVQRDLMDLYGIPEDRFDLVQPPADPGFRRIENADRIAAVRAAHKLPERYVLYVGLLQPRKNLERLAEAFKSLLDTVPHNLVIVGKKAWLYDDMLTRIERLQLGDRLQFTGYVAQEDLPVLMSGADAFAYVSEYEGFGIPVLEALSCGTPVLASTDPALTEVAGGAALHVDPLDVDAIRTGLHGILTDDGLRARLRTAGPARAAAFSQRRMAEAALAGYRAL